MNFHFSADLGVPFGVVFGGTDVNEDVKDEHKRAVMEEVLRKARSKFTLSLMKAAILSCFPALVGYN